jgi:predicted nucleic acid-binding protein
MRTTLTLDEDVAEQPAWLREEHKMTLPDTHLAAIAIGHDLTLASANTDFAKFPGLRYENPLAD